MTEGNLDLIPEHQALIEASAISMEVAAARGYRSIGRAEARELRFTGNQARPGLLIPIHRVDGEPGGYQLRPDEPRSKNGKVIKYETPKEQFNVLDVPPSVRDELRKGRQSIAITEGARKADALASLGIPVISVAGVWNWRGKNKDGGVTALPDWEQINIKGSIFVLMFDSDILSKMGVHVALSRLKRWLEHKGARLVRVLVLPSLLSGKTGVDDYIAATGATAEDLARLVVDALPAPPSKAPEDSGEPVNLAEMLDDLVAFVRQYVVVTAHQADAAALWAAHAHAIKAAETTPYLSIRSAEKRSGKTRALEVLENLVPEPLKAENISVAALAHLVDAGATLLLDEVDTLFRRGKGVASETQEMLRGILDSGYRASGAYVRMAGQGASMTPRKFRTFGAKALSGIGVLPGTLDDRSIIMTLKRKGPRETVKRFRYREAREESAPIRDRLSRWTPGAIDALRDARPELPPELDDRAQDGWEPLLAIADLASGDWGKRARDAAIALSALRAEREEDDSLGIRLLSDIKSVLSDASEISSVALIERLCRLEESPWADLHGKSLTPRRLATLLRGFGIRSHTVRTQAGVVKGFKASDFEDSFSRYLNDPECNGDTVTPHDTAAHGVEGEKVKNGSSYGSVPMAPRVTDVTDRNSGQGRWGEL